MNPEPPNFLAKLTGCFATPVAENPTVAMVEAAFHRHGLNWRYINCEVPPERLADAVRGAKAMGWVGFNCSIPHKIAVIEHLDGLGDSAKIIGAVNTVVLRGDKYIGEKADGIPNPPRTLWIRDAEARGCRVMDGLAMLVNQGVIGIKYWTGVDADVTVMRKALEKALSL